MPDSVTTTDRHYVRTLESAYWKPIEDGSLHFVTIGQRLDEAAEDSAEVTALTEVTVEGVVGRRWTYSELRHEAVRLAQLLVARHEPRTKIAVWANNIPEWVILEYAAAYAGLTLVTVNPSFQAKEAQFVIEQSKATAIYFVPSVRGNPIGRMVDAIAATLPQVQQTVDMSAPEQLFADEQGDKTLPLVNPEDPAQIQYTSGTTGVPKGALLHHYGLSENARLHAERGGMRAGDVIMNVMPMFHTGGCGVLTLGPLAARATEVIFAQFDPAHAVRAIESEGITCVFGVPTMITGMIEAQAKLNCDVSTVKNIIAGGSMVAPELVRAAQKTFGAAFQIIYGQTETHPVLTMVWEDDVIEDVTETVGQPLPYVELAIIDTDKGGIVDVDTVGEVCARGPMTMLEYYDRPDATNSTIDNEGWLHTGDLGKLDERGYLRICGRVKEMIIRGGENLFPAEIENAMLEHPGLAEVAVVGLPDDKYGEIVACFMRPAMERKPAREQLVTFCRERLSPQKTPAVWIYVDDWPLTGSGKVRKFALRDNYLNGEYRAGEI